MRERALHGIQKAMIRDETVTAYLPCSLLDAATSVWARSGAHPE